jgi:hypothetical protein
VTDIADNWHVGRKSVYNWLNRYSERQGLALEARWSIAPSRRARASASPSSSTMRAKRRSMSRERGLHRFGIAFPKFGAALDVGEEEGDGTRWEISQRQHSMRARQPKSCMTAGSRLYTIWPMVKAASRWRGLCTTRC